MIIDKLANWWLYAGMNDGFDTAFSALERLLSKEPADGKYVLDGEKLYASVQSYQTQEHSERKWEAHRDYIDIQFIWQGQEIIGWSPVEELVPVGTYSKTNDVQFFSGEMNTCLKVSEGVFAVFFPGDAHRPGCMWEEAEAVKKIVVKIKVD